jgi:phenylacetate-coenzyme A ligase PaaK-like adenylate-forming protein
MRWGSLLGGNCIPEPSQVPHDDPLPIVKWMEKVLKTGKTPFLFAFSSSAVRLCQTAVKQGIDLTGAMFFTGGEPITDARLKVIQSCGAGLMSIYTSIETGHVGNSCLNNNAPDDMHLFHDLNAVIQPDFEFPEFPPTALFITSLQITGNPLLLNVSMGDMAVIEERECGCPLQDFGWDMHLHSIRSYEKLTAAGLTMLDIDIIKVLEEYLPTRFGGGPTDYQLIEDETDGQPRLSLLVNPELGQINSDKIHKSFLEGIRANNNGLWRTPGFFSVVRRKPTATTSGKILHLNVGQSANARYK